MKAKTVLLLLVFPLITLAAPLRFEIKDLTQRNLLAVVSDAPLEKMIARCHLLQGWIELDPEELQTGIKGELELDLRACETGSGLRDLVLQEKMLEIKKYPVVKVQIKKWFHEVKGGLTERAGDSHLVECLLTYRDKTLPIEAPLRLSYFKEGEKTRNRLPGNLLRLSSQWELGLSSLGISIPSDLKETVSSKVEVVFDAVGTNKPPNEKKLLPEGPKPKERS